MNISSVFLKVSSLTLDNGKQTQTVGNCVCVCVCVCGVCVCVCDCVW